MKKRIQLKRKYGIFERALPWIGISLVFLCLCSFGMFLSMNFIRDLLETTRVSMLILISALGASVVLLSLIVGFYSARKRLLQEKLPGTMMSWLKSHIYLGLLAFGLALVHAFIAIVKAEPSGGSLSLTVFLILVVSGIFWRIVYVAFPPVVADSVGNLAVKDTNAKAHLVQVEMDKLLAGKSSEFRRGAMEGVKFGNWKRIESSLRLPPEETGEWENWKRLADRVIRYARRERAQKFYAAFMQGWKWLHIPLAILFLFIVSFHVLEVFTNISKPVHGALTGLPPATECKRCHADIYEEWSVSMHSQAQSGPVVVAQTIMALEKHPEFGRACNNCHAPIGTSITQEVILPLDAENVFRPEPNGAVMDDGVTCIVCHTLEAAPEERRGMADHFPVGVGGAKSFTDMFGPSLGETPALPNVWHESKTGFMTDNISSSRLCGSCHNVKVDIDGDGEITAFPGSDGSFSDLDEDNQLDENELEFDDEGKLEDLVLQTTFDEWEDYVALQESRGQPALGCVDCHMPQLPNGPVVSPESGYPFPIAQERERQSHTFAGVDYDLAPDRYTPEQFAHVQEEREALLRSAASLTIDLVHNAEDGTITATVTVQSNLVGHSLPTGFAFARQMWLEVSAVTVDGEPVCLTDIETEFGTIGAQCASGVIETPQADLLTCNPLSVAKFGIKPSKNGELIVLNKDATAPIEDCDPWLANFQKVLTEPIGETFFERPYQTPAADIVKTRVRVSDGQAMDAINPTTLVNGQVRDSASFDYVFDAAEFPGEQIVVNAVFHFRHLPPYFVRGLEDYYPEGITPEILLQNMTVIDMAEASGIILLP
ncbi:MAG: hypothetical protein HUU11_17760 [Anaerolineales bacterium]|nr:hypothetical protein [Anaerolineales bacterium]